MGITLTDLIRMFPDDDTAAAFFAAERWPDGVGCPRCGDTNVQSGTAHKTMPYRCRGCGKRFSVRTGTVTAKELRISFASLEAQNPL